MYTLFDVNTWNRREAYHFFKSYNDPYVDATVEIDVSPLYSYCKQHHVSFAYATLWVAMKICNEVDNFRLRMVGDEVRLYNEVHAGQTIGYEDGTYTNAFFRYYPDMEEFCLRSREHVAERKSGPKEHEARTESPDMIHTSILPWLSFLSVKNPRRDPHDSIPKINFGKASLRENGKRVMPVALSVHHSLMDGYQLGVFFNRYQEIIDRLRV